MNMESLEYIESYFEKKLSPDETGKFEQRIKDEPNFAEEVSFYLASKQAAMSTLAEEKKNRFREIYQSKEVALPLRTLKLWPAVAAAAIVIGIVFGVFMWMKPVSTEQLADKYMQDNLKTLGVTMDSKENSLQTGLRLYNDSKYADALNQFESIIQSDTSDFTAVEYAGKTALQLKQYDKALYWFVQLENRPGLFSNPGKFYHALTLMKRNLPGDKDKSYQLLNEVVTNNLAEKNEAEKWLKKW